MEHLTGQDPTHIGPYRLIARLGAGGMGLVYLGRSDLGRTVAVKVVQAEHAQHPEFRKRFAREVAAARRVGGAWTADVLDADTEAAVPWVATQYIPGPDLTAVVAKDYGPLPEGSVRTLANRLALALQAIHEAGLIHRDLKPSNVLVTVDGPRVIDFGIARAMDSLIGDSLHTRTGMLIGSPGFMSPEQVRGLELTPASDVFCLGALLVYASTGRLLFGATDTGLNAHLFRIAEEEADLTGVPDPLVDLVRACLHKDPSQRPTPHEVATRTAAVQTDEWLPGAVLAQLGRRAAHLLDYTPAVAPPALVAQPAPQSLSTPTPPPPPRYAPTAPAYPPGFGTGRRRGLVALGVAQLLVLLDATFMGVVMWESEYSRGLDLALDSVQVTSTVYIDLLPAFYVLPFLLLLPFGARIADRAGRKRTLLIALVGVAVAAAIGGAAPNAATLAVVRVLTGAFAALVASSAPLLVAASFTDPHERRKACATYVAIAGSGPALGLTATWLLPAGLTWRWCLFAMTLLAAGAAIATAKLVDDRPDRIGARSDTLAILLGCGGIIASSWVIPYFENRTLILPPVAAVLLVAFVWQQTRSASALAAAPGSAPEPPIGYFLATALTGLGAFGLLMAMGYY
ncbi:bifunctional serine/threonine protein kinase/MFS transporter [Streptomyces sp. NPDC006670]|uniref:bifunctional serine/threonine protein kinase/MFS transporter n=1 Tax=Streptomyces sp. NPDC006670 TaxID=3154476 RepID=UPI0033F541A3